MNKNIGCVDKIIRVIVGVVAIYLGIKVNAWFYLVAFISLGTAAISWCGLYALLGINTCPVKEVKKAKKK